MCESLGDPKHLNFIGRGKGLEVKAGPFAEAGRVRAEIDRDVPDVAGEDADEFSLGFDQLIVEAAQHTPDGEGLIVLDEAGGQAGGREG